MCIYSNCSVLFSIKLSSFNNSQTLLKAYGYFLFAENAYFFGRELMGANFSVRENLKTAYLESKCSLVDYNS